MLSKLHWQKRTRRKSQQSFDANSLSVQASPELKPAKKSPSPPSYRPGFLSRVRSQRFSTYPETSRNAVSKRHSYYQPAQPLYDTTEAQRPRSATPDHFVPLRQSPSPVLASSDSPLSLTPSIYTTGSERGESLSAVWNPGQLVPGEEQQYGEGSAAMSINGSSSLSSESGAPMDRFMQRRLQRLNTEQGFREQRQASLSQSQSQSQHSKPPLSSAQLSDLQQQQPLPQPSPPHHHHHQSSQAELHHSDLPLQSRVPVVNPDIPAPSTTSTTPSSSSTLSHSHLRHDPPQPSVYQPLRNFTKLHDDGPIHLSTANQPSSSMAPSNQNSASNTRKPSILSHNDAGRSTSQLKAEDLTEDEIRRLLSEHKELREKYQKVKKYYFEKEDQVKQLQNSLAHQRIAQSRTSLDDGEYSARFNRLDGLIAQLSFSVRKCWKSVPAWLTLAVNKDAIAIGKQEMTAVGRAFISKWLVEDVFDRYFHPDLELDLSTQLKQMQNNIRLFAPPSSMHEDEELLTSKVINWRLTTLESMQDILRLPEASTHRAHMTELLKTQLLTSLQAHLDNPPMSDLEGGIHMICELAVSMLGHLPQESRDLKIEYFLPGSKVNPDLMKIESGIPALVTPMADESADHSSTHSDPADSSDPASVDTGSRKRNLLSTLTAPKKSQEAQGKLNGRGSNTSLSGSEERVRLAVGIAAHVWERNILVKAPVFTIT